MDANSVRPFIIPPRGASIITDAWFVSPHESVSVPWVEAVQNQWTERVPSAYDEAPTSPSSGRMRVNAHRDSTTSDRLLEALGIWLVGAMFCLFTVQLVSRLSD